MLKSLVYVSSSVGSISKADLLQILEKSSINNKIFNITGMLIYYDGTFVQALEGEASDIEKIMSKMSTDPRHKNIITIMDEEISEREFGDWEMGFRLLNPKDVQSLGKFVDLDNFSLSGGEAKDLLKTFYDVNIKGMNKYYF